MRHSTAMDLTRAVISDVDTVEQNPARQRRSQPGDALHQLRLTVALNAGNPDYLPSPHLERHPVDRQVGTVIEYGQLFDRQDDLAGIRSLLLDREEDRAPYHQSLRGALSLRWPGLPRPPTCHL